jgi:hypothetical protein
MLKTLLLVGGIWLMISVLFTIALAITARRRLRQQ